MYYVQLPTDNILQVIIDAAWQINCIWMWWVRTEGDRQQEEQASRDSN